MTTSLARPPAANGSYTVALVVLAVSAFAAVGLGVWLDAADSLFLWWVAMAIFPSAVGALAGWIRVHWALAAMVGLTAIVTLLSSYWIADTEPGSDNSAWFFWVGFALTVAMQAPFAIVAYVGACALRSVRT